MAKNLADFIEELQSLRLLVGPDAQVVVHHSTDGEFGADDDLTDISVDVQHSTKNGEPDKIVINVR